MKIMSRRKDGGSINNYSVMSLQDKLFTASTPFQSNMTFISRKQGLLFSIYLIFSNMLTLDAVPRLIKNIYLSSRKKRVFLNLVIANENRLTN